MRLRYSTAAVFCFALLLAQWLGLQHRVAHAPLSDAGPVLSALTQEKAASELGGAGHDCKLFDHAAQGDGVAAVHQSTLSFSVTFVSCPAMPVVATTLRHARPLAQGPPVAV
jgi:hypothetical protein